MAGIELSVTDVSHDLGSLWSSALRELHALAARFLRTERMGHTLQPTALISEVWLRLRRDRQAYDRAGFLRAAASAMRRILVEHARARSRKKRAVNGVRVALEEQVSTRSVDASSILEVDELLTQLAAISARRAEVLQLRYFGGLSEVEIAEAVDVSLRTVQYELASARAWMLVRLTGGGRDSG